METEKSVPISEINININYETDAETVLDADTEYRTKKMRKLFYIYSGLVSGLLSAYMSISWVVNEGTYLPYLNDVGIIFNNLFTYNVIQQMEVYLKYDNDNMTSCIWLAILLFVITGGIISPEIEAIDIAIYLMALTYPAKGLSMSILKRILIEIRISNIDIKIKIYNHILYDYI